MNFNDLVESIVNSLKTKNPYLVKYDGRKYKTSAYSERSALANIGARIAKENNISKEFFSKYIQKVLDNGKAKMIEEKCWKNYKQVGYKKKGKRNVPNCVKIKSRKTK
jgi:predicted transcriptional regulator